MIFNEPEDLSSRSNSSSEHFRRRNNKKLDKDDTSDLSYNDVDTLGEDGEISKDESLLKKLNKKKSSKSNSFDVNILSDKENKKSSLNFFSKKNNTNYDDGSSTEVILDNSEEKTTDIEDNKSKKIENTNSNFKSSEITEIIKECNIYY